MRFVAALAVLWVAQFPLGIAQAQEPSCIIIYHDEAAAEEDGSAGPINSIMLANLLGHWPEYEVRVRPIASYRSSDLEACKVTFFLGTGAESEIPAAFLKDFLETNKRVAWIGFGVEQLPADKFEKVFEHRALGQVTVENAKTTDPAFYQFVSYKGSLFRKSVDVHDGQADGAFEAVLFSPTTATADKKVVGRLIHNRTHIAIPYFLRSGNKFVIGDLPMSYMHEGDRYFAFADLLFDILGEEPLRKTHFAFARTEDVHAYCEAYLLKAAFRALRSEDVPISIAHIPLFMDPLGSFGLGNITTPRAANEEPDFLSLIKRIRQNPKNAVLWHGVTHQFGLHKNPHTGTSADDYEFWNMVANRPVIGDSVTATLSRLKKALPVFSAYGEAPRYWVTPHYHASALDNRVFARVFPWIVGRVTYYPSSLGPTFTLPAARRTDSLAVPSVTRERLEALKSEKWEKLDKRSKQPQTQMFPFEIYRDVYGQRVVPETLNYLSFATTDQTGFVRTADDMLADARRNLVVRDYWASFFYHPYIFGIGGEGGHGRYKGDTFELRKLLAGLKMLGYSFVGLSEFEESLSPQPGKSAQAVPNQPIQ